MEEEISQTLRHGNLEAIIHELVSTLTTLNILGIPNEIPCHDRKIETQARQTTFQIKYKYQVFNFGLFRLKLRRPSWSFNVEEC